MDDHIVSYNKQLNLKQAERLARAIIIMKKINTPTTITISTPHKVYEIKEY